ncbi:hypothetical protein B1R27_26905 [Streptomyces sp. GKU 895]|nr:hypothetical protein B1R27_26905 [Streptomyces sp. GKU 895]
MIQKDLAAVNVLLSVGGEVVSTGLEALLLRLPPIDKVQACTPDDLASQLATGSWDVLIVGFDQWGALATYADSGPLPVVLVLGDEAPDERGDLYASLPADGFLSLADLSAQSLESTLARAIAGEMPMPPSLARWLLAGNPTRVSGNDARTVALTPRERETLSLLAKGLSNKQIARAMSISSHGAKRLVGSLLLKLGVSNRTAAVITALKAGLV